MSWAIEENENCDFNVSHRRLMPEARLWGAVLFTAIADEDDEWIYGRKEELRDVCAGMCGAIGISYDAFIKLYEAKKNDCYRKVHRYSGRYYSSGMFSRRNGARCAKRTEANSAPADGGKRRVKGAHSQFSNFFHRGF